MMLIILLSPAVFGTLALVSHQSAVRQGKSAALVHCAVRISSLQPAGGLKVCPEQSSYFWVTALCLLGDCVPFGPLSCYFET